ncbi:alpha/beta hydrolase [Lacticaseibacillus parakribbianus]|uniref:alpha/beta hydrolase n=1 Tax=Lacticaseibacillus parakribbianus TaxID=2970927 RepID=UPI0021CB6453|nr:alpha/beta hydrolase [Lacticaseibacillus parakribbianus]
MQQTEIPYGQGPLQRADFYLPVHPNQAAIVFVHGGGWFRGDKSREVALGQTLAAAGYLVAIPNYRLAPAALFPTAQEDLGAFLAWLAASPWAFDRSRVGLLGASAGGTMALLQSQVSGQPVVAWSALVDFADWLAHHRAVQPSPDAATALGLHDPSAIHAAFYKYVVTTYLGTVTPPRLAALTPQAGTDSALGPALLFNSAAELVPLAGPKRFVARAQAAGHAVALQVVPGTAHARHYTDQALPATLAFFARHLLAPNP